MSTPLITQADFLWPPFYLKTVKKSIVIKLYKLFTLTDKKLIRKIIIELGFFCDGE